MFRRLLVVAALALVPASVLADLPVAPAPTTPTIVSGAQLDSFTHSTISSTVIEQQALFGYDMKFHTDAMQYSFPVCKDVSMVEVDGRTIEPTSFVPGDTLSITIRPNSAATAKGCVTRIVRYQIGRGASGGECLQDFQVKHEIDESPGRLVINTAYTYQLTAYTRPTFDCDGKAYGSAPITTMVAARKQFLVTLTKTDTGTELMRWTITTDEAGKASFSYSFDGPSDFYQFEVSPGADATAGDSITWDAKVIDPDQQSSPQPLATANSNALSPWPIIILMLLIAIGAGTAEYFHRVRYFQRRNETPEEEYERAKKIRWRD